MPVGSPNRNSDRMMRQSGPYPWPRGNDTTHPPLHNFQSEYMATRPDAMALPIAEPFVPNDGTGPRPRMRITLNTRFITVIAMPSTIGVRASPAERSAALSMKNISMPPMKTNMMRMNGSASALTAGAALTKSSSHGDAT